jgi:hypothetical protein
MPYRNIRKIATGEWVNVLFTTTGESFSVSAESHVADIASALSLNANELEAVDGDSDVRTGALISLPSTSLERKDELLAVGRDNWTDAQQKELIEILAREP